MKAPVLSILLLPLGAFALEALGPVYPVAEPDLHSILKAYAQEARADKRASSEKTLGVLEKSLSLPRRLPRAETGRAWRALAPKESGAVPSFERKWLLFDAEDSLQARYAKNILERFPGTIPVLVSGSLIKAQKALGRRAYLDQKGFLTEKLGVRALPCAARFTEEGAFLREIVLEEEP